MSQTVSSTKITVSIEKITWVSLCVTALSLTTNQIISIYVMTWRQVVRRFLSERYFYWRPFGDKEFVRGDSDSWSVKTHSCCQLQVWRDGGEENDIVKPDWRGMFLTPYIQPRSAVCKYADKI